MKKSSNSLFYNVENRYIALYLANLLFNIIFFNFSDRFQYDLTSMASYNTIYLLIILIYRPYKHHLHNFHIVYNQIIYILWVILLIYQDRATEKLSWQSKIYSLNNSCFCSIVISDHCLDQNLAGVRLEWQSGKKDKQISWTLAINFE